MIPVRGYKDRKVGVLGLGRSGLATARALRAGGAQALCWDDSEPACAAARAEGFAIADLTAPETWDGIAALIVSPGVPHLYPRPHPAVERAWATGAPLDNDIGLFFAALAGLIDADAGFDEGPEPKVVCVTGSNGKSTVTALIGHILHAAGRSAQMGGNIGRGALDLDPPGRGETVVLELSSYQIELARALNPDIAVFLNLSPDHIDRHGGIGGYFAAKKRLFEVGLPGRAVIGIDEPEGRFLRAGLRGEGADPAIEISLQRRASAEGWSVCARDGQLIERRRGREVMRLDLAPALALRGEHNRQNACAAYAVCRSLGLGGRAIRDALYDFPGLPHRLERVGEKDGVLFVNDSKATNADAAQKALATCDKVRWVAGGQSKDGGIEALRPLFGRVVKTYLIGEAAGAFAATLGAAPHEICGTLEAATARALAEAQPGETVLLSPGCASFDQFRSFEHRGDVFRALIARFVERKTQGKSA